MTDGRKKSEMWGFAGGNNMVSSAVYYCQQLLQIRKRKILKFVKIAEPVKLRIDQKEE